MQFNTVLYFIAGRIASEIEKAAISELKLTAKNVIVLCAKFVDSKYYKADAVGGTVPDVYSDHHVITTEAERKASSISEAIENAVIDAATVVIDEIGDAVETAVETVLDWATDEQPTEQDEPEAPQVDASDAWGTPAPDAWGTPQTAVFPAATSDAHMELAAPVAPSVGARKPKRGRR